MTLNFSSWIRGGIRPVLAALPILAVLSLAAPSASAAVALSYKANGGAAVGLTDGVSTGNVTLGNFTYSVTASSTDLPAVDNLTTTTITLNNSSSTTDTLTLQVTGVGFTLGGTAFSGENLLANFSVSGTGGPTNKATDTTTGMSWADVSNTPFGTGTPLGSLTGAPPTTGVTTTAYVFGSGGVGPITFLTLTSGVFSLSQTLAITLGGGDRANLTIITNAVPTPEPSSMAIAGLGALGLIGYGIRRRRSR